MNPIIFTLRRRGSTVLAVICAVAIGRGDALAYVLVAAPAGAQSTTQRAPQSQDVAIPADQLDSLVAPIALYPDQLLAQTLAASTYPLEIMQLQQWLAKNPGLQGKALADAVATQPWDPSVQAMAAFPDVVKQLADNLQWTTDLGNAFLAQESDVMNAVQRMRQKAEGTGTLQSTPQQVVETRTIENKEVIVIEPASPDVVYVPSYNPTVVYGAAPAYYPYPPISYPSAGYWGSAAIGFGVGLAVGSFWGSGGWGWNAGWGRGDINVNRNANFVRNNNFYRNGNTWRHNAAHRGGAAYGSRGTAARYGGSYRGQSFSNRAAGARQQINRQGGNLASQRGNFANQRGNIGTAGRPGTAGANRAGVAGTAGRNFSGQRPGTVNRPGTANRGSVGTSGMTNRSPGSVTRGNYSGNRGNVNRGNYSGNRGSFSRGNRGGFSGGGGRRGGGGGGGRRGGGGGRRR